ncbi:hypothetical protein HMPREF9419_2064 [Prevotella nigrescens ATCC 33563]|nr:hypothetical protein HMPREF9419_2064 [Prevotella nigrescens ATCC 33563]
MPFIHGKAAFPFFSAHLTGFQFVLQIRKYITHFGNTILFCR